MHPAGKATGHVAPLALNPERLVPVYRYIQRTSDWRLRARAEIDVPEEITSQRRST